MVYEALKTDNVQAYDPWMVFRIMQCIYTVLGVGNKRYKAYAISGFSSK